MNKQSVTRLFDRDAIRDCLHRYCRGIDRADEAALRSCYWPDARDNHGSYSGSVDGFIQLAVGVFKTQPRNIHQITNIMFEFRSPAEAAVESYFTALQRGPDGAGEVTQVLLCGRYCDLFQKREGEWRILERVVVYDWVEEQKPPTSLEPERFGPRQPIGAPHPNDPVYALSKRRIAATSHPEDRVGSGDEEL
ncbi:nuclear transport factor 2 family protein [Sinorhizobium sp. 7-81]|uniref:nuclear transport factor 2 family protein n=1 Tax=unclassified Sinorhizobium TaxID=2613772 RepID=UPI0024C2A6D1|nr:MULTISPECIES: nuclear transport factor 2 family protein [unclassified Sinorhizobium]MDK1389283.1 nuclear transport factor 2 family protein [Sinorhizobium sp. 7-81]MDK1493562.1 nuclear transport factor 2 family protein [Sinorhizobium sp. 8-89]